MVFGVRRFPTLQEVGTALGLREARGRGLDERVALCAGVGWLSSWIYRARALADVNRICGKCWRTVSCKLG